MNLDQIILKPNKWYPDGMRRFDVYKYYERMGDRMLPLFKGRNVALLRRTSSGDFFQRHPFGQKGRYIQIETQEQLLDHAKGGAVEFIPEMCEREGQGILNGMLIDLDPRGETTFGEVKWATVQFQRFLDVLGYEYEILFTGNKGFHFRIPWVIKSCESMRDLAWGLVKKAFPDETKEGLIRRTIKQSDKDKNGIIFDTSSMKPHGCARSKWSIHAKTGLRCVPVEIVEYFKAEHSVVDLDAMFKVPEVLNGT